MCIQNVALSVFCEYVAVSPCSADTDATRPVVSGNNNVTSMNAGNSPPSVEDPVTPVDFGFVPSVSVIDRGYFSNFTWLFLSVQ